MSKDTVKLALPTSNGSLDNSRIIQQEMQEMRQTDMGKLPKLAKKAAKMSLSKLAEQLEGPGGGQSTSLPRVTGGMKEKYQAARRGAMLMGALGHPGLEKLQAKEDQEKRRRKQRIHDQNQANIAAKSLSRDPSHRRSRPGGPGDADGRRASMSLELPPALRGSRSGHLATAMSARSTAGPRTGRYSRAGTLASRRSSRRGPSMGGDSGWEGDDEDEDVVRGDSRVGQLLGEFAHREDWVSKTILRHQMASVLQANVRGWLTRMRWRQDRERVVTSLHEKLDAEAHARERRERLRRQLEMKTMTNKQKKAAVNVVTKLFGARAMATAPPAAPAAAGKSKWGKLGRNLDIATKDAAQEEVVGAALAQGVDRDLVDPLASGSGSDFSDLEMEDIAAVKLRARTPPWQRVEESQRVGQYAKLGAKQQMGNLEVLWDLDACGGRLAAAKARRLARAPGEADTQAGGAHSVFDPATEDLPPQVITDLLYPKYLNKYARMGKLHMNPLGRPGDAEYLAQQAAAAAAAAAGVGAAGTEAQPEEPAEAQASNAAAAAAEAAASPAGPGSGEGAAGEPAGPGSVEVEAAAGQARSEAGGSEGIPATG